MRGLFRLFLQAFEMIAREHHVFGRPAARYRGAAGNDQMQRVFHRHIQLKDVIFWKKNEETAGGVGRVWHENAHDLLLQGLLKLAAYLLHEKTQAPHAPAGEGYEHGLFKKIALLAEERLADLANGAVDAADEGNAIDGAVAHFHDFFAEITPRRHAHAENQKQERDEAHARHRLTGEDAAKRFTQQDENDLLQNAVNRQEKLIDDINREADGNQHQQSGEEIAFDFGGKTQFWAGQSGAGHAHLDLSFACGCRTTV